jgi:hypothetical protein
MITNIITTYNVYNTKALFINNSIILNVELGNSDIINNSSYLKIDNKKYNYTIKSISDIKVDNFINYQEFQIEVNNCFIENQVLDITFYYKKEKIIKKIIDIIF